MVKRAQKPTYAMTMALAALDLRTLPRGWLDLNVGDDAPDVGSSDDDGLFPALNILSLSAVFFVISVGIESEGYITDNSDTIDICIMCGCSGERGEMKRRNE